MYLSNVTASGKFCQLLENSIESAAVAASVRQAAANARRLYPHILLQPCACSLRPGRLLVHWQGTSALAHLRTGDPSQMEEAAPRGVHALSFASLAHKSFIKDVSFAYTEGRQMPLRTRMKYRYKRLLRALLGLCVCLLVWESNFLCDKPCTTIHHPNLVRVPS